VSTSRVSACGVAATASMLRLCRCEQTHESQENQDYSRQSRKEGNSFGHSLPIPKESVASLLLFARIESVASAGAKRCAEG
jgi:hypothetical protein